MFCLLFLLATIAVARSEGIGHGENYDEGFAVLNPSASAIITEIGRRSSDHGRLMCATGCASAYDTYTIEHNFVLSGQNCDGAKYDPAYLQKRTIEEGRRFTGVFDGWRCQMRRDPACPESYEYFAFMAYGCEERNGTKYWITHTYKKLHQLLMKL